MMAGYGRTDLGGGLALDVHELLFLLVCHLLDVEALLYGLFRNFFILFVVQVCVLYLPLANGRISL